MTAEYRFRWDAFALDWLILVVSVIAVGMVAGVALTLTVGLYLWVVLPAAWGVQIATAIWWNFKVMSFRDIGYRIEHSEPAP